MSNAPEIAIQTVQQIKLRLSQEIAKINDIAKGQGIRYSHGFTDVLDLAALASLLKCIFLATVIRAD